MSESDDLDKVHHRFMLRGERREQFERLEEIKQFFQMGGGNSTSCDRALIWSYRRLLGVGGNGIASAWRISAAMYPERYQDVAIKASVRGWESASLRKERELMKVRFCSLPQTIHRLSPSTLLSDLEPPRAEPDRVLITHALSSMM